MLHLSRRVRLLTTLSKMLVPKPFQKMKIEWISNQSIQEDPKQHGSNESVGYQFGSIYGSIKQNLAKYMAKSLASKNLYERCADEIEYRHFFDACAMPDTFQSWFYVMHLHVWMLLVRLRSEGSAGKSLSYNMVEIMWKDVEERMKLIGLEDMSGRRETLEEFTQQFFGMIVAYDEGLLGHDRVLASALWRNLFYNKPNTDAEKLALVVAYVRKQIQHIESQSSDELLLEGKVNWLPLAEDKQEDISECKSYIDPG